MFVRLSGISLVEIGLGFKKDRLPLLVWPLVVTWPGYDQSSYNSQDYVSSLPDPADDLETEYGPANTVLMPTGLY